MTHMLLNSQTPMPYNCARQHIDHVFRQSTREKIYLVALIAVGMECNTLLMTEFFGIFTQKKLT
jgi:hypothetical protein